MTIGVAATLLIEGRASFFLVADSRASAEEERSDLAVKTYSLDQRVGVVAAGNAISCVTAVELTREIVIDHNRLQPDKPISFYSSVRLFSYLLDKVDRDRSWSPGCEVALVGFLTNGTPAMAKVITHGNKETETEVFVYAPKQPGALIAMVGKPDAKEQIVAALNRSVAAPGLEWMDRVAGTIWYLCEHDGEPNIGGGISIALCSDGDPMHWPIVGVGERRFMRGIELTGVINPQTQALNLQYDESWHAEVDQQRVMPAQRIDEGFEAAAHTVKDWIAPNDVFQWKVDPENLARALDRALPPATVIIGRPGELPTFRTGSTPDDG